MYGRERRVLLRHYLEQGLSKAEIARMLGVCRRTLYQWINTGQLDRDLGNRPVRYTTRPSMSCKIDRYRGMIRERLGEYPKLSATRLYEEIRAAGYAGCYSQVKEYVREVRPRTPEVPVVRFETIAGLQAQVDFAEFPLRWGKRFALPLVSKTEIATRTGQLSAARLRMVRDYIESNHGRHIMLSELAGCMRLSTPRFCHIFRNSTGLSPHQYLIRRRIEHAKLMLRSKNLDLAEMALALGFDSQSHFTAAFRMMTGLTPMRYRQSR
jgi:AraC-like DNA-binding protein/transposase-like protein